MLASAQGRSLKADLGPSAQQPSFWACNIRLKNGKVVAANYTGDNDDLIGKEGICAPIFRGCLREYEKGAKARTAAR